MNRDKKIKVLGISGSLRKGSFNSAILENAKNLAPANMEIESFDISNIPVFNQDMESNLPERVKEFKNKIESADAILFVTPEYNYSFPGGLKNAIDFAGILCAGHDIGQPIVGIPILQYAVENTVLFCFAYKRG